MNLTPLTITYSINIIVIIGSFIISTLTNSFYTIDRLWSILPMIYSWIYLYYTPNMKSIIMSTLISLWGIRLTYNFYRKGGYNGQHEDYRWKPIRESILIFTSYKLINQVILFIFSLFFVSFFQAHLLWGIVLPMEYNFQNPNLNFNIWDIIATISFIFFLVIEIIADEQQYTFQTMKYKYIQQYPDTEKYLVGDYSRGFLSTGLFYYSRHANFFAEQMLWFCISLYSRDIDLSFIVIKPWFFPLILASLFIGSTWFTEHLSCEKYPTYKIYQKRTGKFIPNLFQSKVVLPEVPFDINLYKKIK